MGLKERILAKTIGMGARANPLLKAAALFGIGLTEEEKLQRQQASELARQASAARNQSYVAGLRAGIGGAKQSVQTMAGITQSTTNRFAQVIVGKDIPQLWWTLVFSAFWIMIMAIGFVLPIPFVGWLSWGIGLIGLVITLSRHEAIRMLMIILAVIALVVFTFGILLGLLSGGITPSGVSSGMGSAISAVTSGQSPIAAIASCVGGGEGAGEVKDGILGKAGDAAGSAKEKGLDKAESMWTRFTKFFSKQMAIATGDYYTGKVDDNAEAQLGVFLIDVEPTDSEFFTDERATVVGTLFAQTLDEPININVSCASKKRVGGVFGDSLIRGNMLPKDAFEVDTYEEEDLDCIFDSGALSSGVSTVAMQADFNFKTMSYLKTYYMDKDRLRALKREGIDPLSEYGVTDKKPVATYTNGPVMIGMEIGTMPIGLDSEEQGHIDTLGITFDNEWDGFVKHLKSFTVILPKGVELIDIQGAQPGSANLKRVTCDELGQEPPECDEDLFNMYKFTFSKREEIKNSHKSYRVHIRIPQSSYAGILGASPISTKYYKVTAEYFYTLEEKTQVKIKSRKILEEGVGTGITPGEEDILPPQIIQPTLTPEETNLTIEFDVNEPAVGYVEWWYKDNPSFRQKVWETEFKGEVTSTGIIDDFIEHINSYFASGLPHRVEIKHLKPGTEIGVKVYAIDLGNNIGYSRELTATTKPLGTS